MFAHCVQMSVVFLFSAHPGVGSGSRVVARDDVSFRYAGLDPASSLRGVCGDIRFASGLYRSRRCVSVWIPDQVRDDGFDNKNLSQHIRDNFALADGDAAFAGEGPADQGDLIGGIALNGDLLASAWFAVEA